MGIHHIQMIFFGHLPSFFAVQEPFPVIKQGLSVALQFFHFEQSSFLRNIVHTFEPFAQSPLVNAVHFLRFSDMHFLAP